MPINHEQFNPIQEEPYEIDFLTEDRLGNRHLYQVVWDTSDPVTMARELKALKAAEKELNIQGKIITPENYLETIHRIYKGEKISLL